LSDLGGILQSSQVKLVEKNVRNSQPEGLRSITHERPVVLAIEYGNEYDKSLKGLGKLNSAIAKKKLPEQQKSLLSSTIDWKDLDLNQQFKQSLTSNYIRRNKKSI